MRLLKTILLSSTLLMGSTAFGSDAVPTEVSETEEATQSFLVTVQKIRDEHAAYLRVVEKQVERLGGTKGTNFVETLTALKASITAVLAKGTALESDLSAATGHLTAATEANQTLAAEKAAVEEALREATDKLAAVTVERDAAARNLTDVEAKVSQLETALRIAEKSATKADEDAIGQIEKVTAELAEANELVRKLKEDAAELEALKALAEESQRQKEAGLRAIKAQIGAFERAVKEGNSAASTSEFDPFENFDSLLIGAEEDECAASSPRSLGDASPLQALDSTPPRSIAVDLAAAAEHDAVVRTGAGLSVAPAAADAKIAAEITKLQAELAKAQSVVAAGTTWKGSDSGPKKAASPAARLSYDQHKAYLAAQKEVARLTADLAKLTASE